MTTDHPTQTAKLIADLEEVHLNLADDDQALVVLTAMGALRRYARNTADTPPATNSGHGHVFPRADGMRARCGGPTVCGPCAMDAAAQARAAAARGGDDELVPVTRGMLRRWERTLHVGHAMAVEEAIRALLAEHADASPDPEGAEATVLAPDSDTAREVGPLHRRPCPSCDYTGGHHLTSDADIPGWHVTCGRPGCGAEWHALGRESDTAGEAR